MGRAADAEDRRMEKFEDALRQWQQRKLTQAEAARLLNCSVRTFRRDVDDYVSNGSQSRPRIGAQY